MSSYKILNKQEFTSGIFSLVPIRYEDRMSIMQWRNEQIYHLRQDKPLTNENQENYFQTVVNKLFNQDKPNQILFSFLENDICIGYGGLVHINWIDKNAEISFIINSAYEKNRFDELWSIYLKLLEEIAFKTLNFHKIYTYAFDLRPKLYKVLELNGYLEESRLKEHCLFNEKFIDVVYHSKINRTISYRKATETDRLLYFNWANDLAVRENSYQSEPISIENHNKWFLNKINDTNSLMIIFENHIGIPIGQVRIEKLEEEKAIIGISNDVNHRGKGYANKMIKIASEIFLKENPQYSISAYIKLENELSKKAFENAEYKFDMILEYNLVKSFHYIKRI